MKLSSVLPDSFSVGESFYATSANFQNTVSDIATGHHGFWILRYDEEHSTFKLRAKRKPIVATAAILLNDNFEGETVILDSTGKNNRTTRAVDGTVHTA